MADARRRRDENVPGPFFVDDTCIDCDTCRWMAPETFHASGGQSAVHDQPGDRAAAMAAARALVACPTASIGLDLKATTPTDDASWLEKGLVREAAASLPYPAWPGTERVFHVGYHSESSFGAASWLIRRDDGNVLVDSPRFNQGLLERIQALGGARWLYLTHRDDVADHAAWTEALGCERVMHKDDVTSGTRDVEVQIEGFEPYTLADDLVVYPCPGHTIGHSVLHDETNEVLFTGDHLAWSPTRERLIAFRRACWYSWDEQVRSMRRLSEAGLRVAHVLPGHNAPGHLPPDEMQRELEACVDWMESVR